MELQAHPRADEEKADLAAPGRFWLAAQYRKAAEVIDAQVFAIQPAAPSAVAGSGR